MHGARGMSRSTAPRAALGATSFLLLAACSGAPTTPGAPATTESTGTAQSALTRDSTSTIASVALANLGLGACSKNSAGGTSYGSSCTGNGGLPEYWCADFAKWVWQQAGADVSGLTAAAGSFYVYGQDHGTLKDTPAVGDAVVFDYQGGGVADHVAIVSKVKADGTIESVSGDWDGQSGTEAQFASTSSVVLNSPAYGSGVGSAPAVIGMTISGYVGPVGVASTPDYAASFVGQSFPLATTALPMAAGETVAAYIEMKNTGAKAWDSSTRLATSKPRDRASAFAAATWIASNRLADVKGTVAPGATYKFEFVLHAPAKPGTYFEYFDLVEEGVAWFSDPGQGGPPDDDLEVQVVVSAAPAGSDAGGVATAADAGGIEALDAGAPLVPAPAMPAASDAPADPASPAAAPAAAGGCAVGARWPGDRGAGPVAWLLGLVAVVATLRRWRSRQPGPGRRSWPLCRSAGAVRALARNVGTGGAGRPLTEPRSIRRLLASQRASSSGAVAITRRTHSS